MVIPPEHKHRVLYIGAADPAQPFGHNPLRKVRIDKVPLAVSGFLETLRKLWPDAWGVRTEHADWKWNDNLLASPECVG